MERLNERREFLRAGMNVFINEQSRTAKLLGKTMDICERGISYISPAKSPQRDSKEVTLEFCLPGDDRPVRALGRIVYNNTDEHKQGTAIEFTMLRSSDAERIRQYVGRRMRAELFEQLHREHLLN